MLQKVTMFAAAGKFWKKFMVICPKFCSFLALNSAYKVGFPPFIFENLSPPFFSPPQNFFVVPLLFEKFKNRVPPPL